jgi:hypothetical protein
VLAALQLMLLDPDIAAVHDSATAPRSCAMIDPVSPEGAMSAACRMIWSLSPSS